MNSTPTPTTAADTLCRLCEGGLHKLCMHGPACFCPCWRSEDDYANHSKIAAHNRCRYAFHLLYDLGIERRFGRPAMERGSAIHVGMASRLGGSSADEAAFRIKTWADGIRANDLMEEEQAQLRDIEDVARVVVERTVAVLDLGHRWETVLIGDKPAVELEISVPFTRVVPLVGARYRDNVNGAYERRQAIGKFKRARGTMDWIARELETGAVWEIDHKSYSTFQPVEAEETNEQHLVYAYLLRKRYGLETCGSITHQIRPEKPKIPERNKDGSMSRSLIATDWPTYRAALHAAGLDPAEYEEDTFAKTGKVIPGMRAKLGEIEFWRMSRAYWSPAVVEANWQKTFLPAVREIARKGRPIFRSMGPMNCSGCTVRELCLENLRGSDTSFLMRTTYKPRSEPNDFTIPELEE